MAKVCPFLTRYEEGLSLSKASEQLGKKLHGRQADSGERAAVYLQAGILVAKSILKVRLLTFH